jgi:hypothetical protein
MQENLASEALEQARRRIRTLVDIAATHLDTKALDACSIEIAKRLGQTTCRRVEAEIQETQSPAAESHLRLTDE